MHSVLIFFVNFTLVIFPQAIAVILTVFLHRGNGRAITPASNDNIERMLGIVEEELNTALNENPTDVLTLTEPDLPSQEALQSLSDSASGESATKATTVWRHKRSPVQLEHEPNCDTGKKQTVKLAIGGIMSYPICRQVAAGPIACSSSISPNNNNKRKCVGSNLVAVIEDQGSKNVTIAIPTSCSCAPP